MNEKKKIRILTKRNEKLTETIASLNKQLAELNEEYESVLGVLKNEEGKMDAIKNYEKVLEERIKASKEAREVYRKAYRDTIAIQKECKILRKNLKAQLNLDIIQE